MAVVKHIIAPSSSTVPITDGQLVVRSDTARLYIDYDNTRIAITDIEYVNSYPLAPLSDKLYVTSEGARLYHNGSYTELGAREDVTTIPAATSAYTLADGVFRHTPTAAPTYTLPTPSDTSVTHETILTVSFANVVSIAFEDASGNTVAPLDTLSILANDVVQYVCWYDPVQAKWCINATYLNKSYEAGGSGGGGGGGGLTAGEVQRLALIYG